MEKKKFNLEDHKPENKLFKVDERYFEDLPVRLADRLHAEPAPSWWQRMRPALSVGFAASALIAAGLWFTLKQLSPGTNTGSEGQLSSVAAQEDELFHILNHDEDLGPTDEELMEQVARLEDQSEHRAIQEVLDETGYDEEDYLDEI